MNIPDILDKAATVIEKNGWVQGDWYDHLRMEGTEEFIPLSDCPVCAGGGINLATDHVPDYVDEDFNHRDDAFIAFARHISPGLADRASLNKAIETIGCWNDNVDRTAEQVITALRECAAELREAETNVESFGQQNTASHIQDPR